jgi:HEAT repeat protein
MAVRRFVVLVATTALAIGCGKTAPTLAGGKPVGHWVEALHHPDARVRKEAAFKLGNVGPADTAVLPALEGALNDRDPRVRHEVVCALVKFGPGAKEALPTLVEMSRKDQDAQVRTSAAKAAERLRHDE